MTPTALKGIIEATKTEMAKHTAAFPTLLVTSAEKKQGLEAVRAELAALAET